MRDLEPPSWQESRTNVLQNKQLTNIIETPHDTSVFLIDLSCIIQQHAYWKQELPFVTPYYAIKCNPNPIIITLLQQLGTNFDCASEGEIEKVLACGAKPKEIIYANPIKSPSFIEYSKKMGVKKMTFDSVEELKKIASLFPEAQAIMRIAVDDSQSICKFNSKFGAFPDQVQAIFEKALELKIDIAGVSFHVGSGCRDPQTHKNAILSALATIKQGRDHGFSMKILDIGGGYPASNQYIHFSEITKYIREVHDDVQKKNPELQDIEWIGEPGRYMVGTSHTMICEIIGKKEFDGKTRIFLGEGVYGSLSGILFDYMSPLFSIYKKEHLPLTHKATFFGPTCDSLDTMGELDIPEVQIGDKMVFYHIGDYSICSASNFNGFAFPKMYYYISRENDRTIVQNLPVEIL